MFLRRTIKKNSWLFIASLIISLILSSTRRGIDARFFNLVPVVFILFLLLPLVSGIILVLIQNKNRSYEFLPNLLLGSCLNNAIIILTISSIEYFCHGYAYRQFIDIFAMAQLFLPLFAISVFGGLIGLVIKGTSVQLKKYPDSKITLAFKKTFGGIFLSVGGIGASAAIVVFLVLAFHPSSSWLNMVMVDFRLIEVIGVIFYYLLLVSVLLITLIPLTFLVNWGLKLLLEKKFINKKIALRVIVYFFICLAIFLFLSSYTNSKFELKKAAMKANIQESHINIEDFKNIYISPYVEFDDVIIKQDVDFDITVKGSEYDRIGLDFEKTGNTLNIERSYLETFFNTDTWTVENRDILFRAGSKHLTIEITMPDVKKIENEGANIELENLKVDNMEIKLTHRFNNLKGDILVKNTLKLDTKGGIINLEGSAKNLVIDSGDCWIEMDKFFAENAIINAKNTSRLNVNISNNMDIQLNENSGITNHNNIEVWDSVTEELALKLKSGISDINISFPKESSLWWNDEDDYSILVPGTESIKIVRDEGVGADNFTEGGFVTELLNITEQVLSARGFILNKSNSSADETDKRFYDYVQAYKNDNELCVVRVNPDYSSHGCTDNMFMCNMVEITCGNNLAESQLQQRPFLEALDLQGKETIVQIKKQIGDYYKVNTGHRRTGSSGVVKKEDSSLRLLYMSQEDPHCEKVEKENIPNEVFDGFGINGCWTEDGYRKFSEN